MAVTYEVIQDTVLSGTTSIGVGASAEVTIRDADTAALVTLFQDRLGAGGETNPFNADANGQFRVYTEPGRLQISILFESVTRIWEDFRLGDVLPPAAPNLLANSGLDIWKQGETFDSTTTPANSDDNYMADQVILLSDGNDRVDVSKETTIIPLGAAAAIKMEVETVSGTSEKFGMMFPVENEEALKAAGQNVSLSISVRTSGLAVRNLRAAVLSWDGAADVITSDLVGAWGAEGANITPAANWTIENTPVDIPLTNAFERFKDEAIAIDTSGMKNLAIFIWVDDTDLVAGDLVYIGKPRLEIGNKATDPPLPDSATESSRCNRYYRRNPASWGDWANSQTEFNFTYHFDPPMRTAPSMAFIAGSGTNATTRPGVTSYNVTAVVSGGGGADIHGAHVRVTTASSGAAPAPGYINKNVVEILARL